MTTAATPLQREDIEDRCDLFAHVLVFVAIWTILVKFAMPAAYAMSIGMPVTTFVMWDLWWAIHLVLAWALTHRERWTFAFGTVVSVLEIGIVLAKFYGYLSQEPVDTSFFRLAWFTNKIAVLLLFMALLPFLLRPETRAYFATEDD